MCLSRTAQRTPDQLSEPGVVERLWHDFAELGPLERHGVDVGAKSAEAVADEVRRGLRGDLLIG